MKNAGALARKGILRAIIDATRGGKYADNAPEKTNNAAMTCCNVCGLRPAVSFSDSMLPAAIPARYVHSSNAKAGARSEEATEKTRNQMISKPRAINPDRPASSMARARGIVD